MQSSTRTGRIGALLSLATLLSTGRDVTALPPGFTDVRFDSPQVTDYEFFGRSVASLGSELVVGAPGSSLPSSGLLPGRVYVVRLDGTARLTIQNPTPSPGDQFGGSVAVVGPNLAVGAPLDDTAATDAGAAYLFDGATGALLRTILVPGAGANAHCARAVAALGNDLLVLCGGVYRFDGATGALVRHYVAPGCLGGSALATIDGDVLSTGYGTGICRFDGATGTVVQTYPDPEPGLGGAFGTSIGVDANRVLVGGAGFSGARESMYLFNAATGALEDTIRGPYYGGPYNAGFGSSVAAAGNVLVGSGWHSARFYDSATSAFLGEFQSELFRVDASRETVTAVFGSSFALWTDTIDPNVGRGSVTLFDRCGNGVHSPAEQCDDGNTASGDGCSATCRLERCPTTFPVSCQALGSRGSSTIQFRKATSGGFATNSDRFRWKWKGVSSLADFGNPVTGTSYQICFYDDLLGTPDLRLDFALPGGALCGGTNCWQPDGSAGFRYDDRARMPSGVEQAKIQATAGRAKIAISGKGRRLGLPETVGPNDSFPFASGWAVVMIESGSGQCWTAGSGAARNSAGRFKGSATAN